MLKLTHAKAFAVGAPVVAFLLGGCAESPVESRSVNEWTIDSTGGTISWPDGTFTLRFPPDAVSEPTVITVEEVPSGQLPNSALPGTVFRFSPAGLKFEEPVELTLDLSSIDLTDGRSSSRLVWHGGVDTADWDVIPRGGIDFDWRMARLSLASFSVYGLGFGPGWRHVVSAREHACALDDEGIAYCWGSNSFGRLGIGSSDVHWSATPRRVEGGHVFVQLEATERRTCGIVETGRMFCWGSALRGGLGDGTDEDRHVPTEVAGGHTFTHMSLGLSSTCGRTAGGDWLCWGNNQYGQLPLEATDVCGTAPCNLLPTPIEVTGLSFKSLDVGWQHGCGLTSAGVVYCWGGNVYGQVGIGETSQRVDSPSPVTGDHSFRFIRTGVGHTCGIDTADASWCWGTNWGHGHLGSGSLDEAVSAPVRVKTSVVFTRLELTADNQIYSPACGLTASGELRCWGPDVGSVLFPDAANEICSRGDESFPCATVPVETAPELAFEQLSVSSHRFCGTQADGEAWCWGNNAGGALGRGVPFDEIETGSPARVLYPWEGGQYGPALSDNENQTASTMVPSVVVDL
jgi:alpha-tubulin suppressor-like RCC1 family protein